MSLKQKINDICPNLSTALSGPFKSIVFSVISNIVLGKIGYEYEISNEISKGLSDQQIKMLKNEESNFVDELNRILNKKNNCIKNVFDHFKHENKESKRRFIFGITIVFLASSLTVAQVVFGSILMFENITISDPALLGFVSNMVGNASGYLLSNAQQVVGFFFGSSSGSTDKTHALIESINKK